MNIQTWYRDKEMTSDKPPALSNVGKESAQLDEERGDSEEIKHTHCLQN